MRRTGDMSYFHPTHAYYLLTFEYLFILQQLLFLCEVVDQHKHLEELLKFGRIGYIQG